MEYRSSQQNLRSSSCSFDEVFHFSRPAGSDDFRGTCLRHRPDDRQIITGLCSVSGFAGRQNHFDTEVIDLFGKIHGIKSGSGAAAINVNLVTGRHRRIHIKVDRNSYCINTEFADELPDKLRAAECRAAGGNFIRTGGQHLPGGFHIADTAADSERNGTDIGDFADDFSQCVAFFHGCGNVK